MRCNAMVLLPLDSKVEREEQPPWVKALGVDVWADTGIRPGRNPVHFPARVHALLAAT